MIPAFQSQDTILSSDFATEDIPLSPSSAEPLIFTQIGDNTRGHFDSEHTTSPKGPTLPGAELCQTPTAAALCVPRRGFNTFPVEHER